MGVYYDCQLDGGAFVFYIQTDGQSLVISPVINAEDEAKFEKSLGELHKKYGRMLKRLAQ